MFHASSCRRRGKCQFVYWAIYVCISFKVTYLADTANGLNFTLASNDGSYYPYLDVLLQNPKHSYTVGRVEELQALSEYNSATRSFLINDIKVVVGESFFSVFSAAQVPLWELNQGSFVVPTYFDVRNDAELFLIGFNLNWGAQPTKGRTLNPTSKVFSAYPLLLSLISKLQLYVELSGNGKLQLLHTVITDVPCDGILKFFDGLNLLSNRSDFLLTLGDNIKPAYRLVYPYFFIKYARLGPIWIEDLTMSCVFQADLSLSACPPRPPTLVPISTHDDLVTALLELEKVNVRNCETHTTVLRLLRHVTLDIARWPRDGGGLFLTSNVTFECAPGEMLVLDLADGLNLFKMRAAAYVRMHNVVVANLAMAPVGVFTVPIWAFNFERNLEVTGEGRLHMVNTTGVIPADEFTHLFYWTSILINPLQAVSALAGWQHLIREMMISGLTNDTLLFNRITGMGVTCVNIAITVRPIDGVHLLRPLTGVNQLIASDFRSGPPYTVAIYSAAQFGRMLLMPNSQLTRLAEADGLTNGSTTPVLLLIQNNITLDPALWPAQLVVQRHVMVQGKPYSGVTLDFGGIAGLLNVTDVGGPVEFRYLTLRGAGWLVNYTAETALQNMPPQNFLQTGMWVVNFERAGAPKVDLQSVHMQISRQEMDLLFTCVNSYSRNTSWGDAGRGESGGKVRALPPGLSEDKCGQLIPGSSKLTNVSRELSVITVSRITLSSFEASELVLEVDEELQRPDLLLLMQGFYPSSLASTSIAAAAGDSSHGTGAIVGGSVGAAGGCVILAVVAALIYSARRSRTRQEAYQEAALRGLQVKQANQLEQLSKRNPLAQLLLDHMAGKEPAAAVATMVLANTATTGGSVVCSPAVHATTDADAVLAARASSGGGGGLAADDCSPTAGVVREVSSSRLPVVAGNVASAPVNINAVDLAELFKHLTILGMANLSNVAGGGSGGGDILDSHGSRSGTRAGGGSGGAGSSGAGSGSIPGVGVGVSGGVSQPLSGLLALSQVVFQRLSRRSRAHKGEQTRERDISDVRAAPGVIGGGSAVLGGVRGARGDFIAHPPHGSSSSSGAVAVSVTAVAGSITAAAAAMGPAVTAVKCMDGAALVARKEAAGSPVGCDVVDPGRGGAAGVSSGAAEAARGSNGKAAAPAVDSAASLPQQLHDQVAQSPVLEELLRLSLDLAGEIDDNQLMVTDVVASGGFGTVYRGTWHNLPVAVKIVLFSTASVNRRVALQEAALSKSISHPNIIATYAVDAKPMAVLGQRGFRSRAVGAIGRGGNLETNSCSLAEIQEWRLYIIQELADGGTLRKALDSGAFHDPHLGLPRMDMILDIVQGVAAALAHLHSKNIVHGDLNPKNVLLRTLPVPGSASASTLSSSRGISPSGIFLQGKVAGGAAGFRGSAAAAAAAASTAAASQYGNYPLAGRCGFAVKVADFGLSVKMENSHISGLRQGTPFYAAPELSQLGIFSRAADTYAFGVLLWELYWGRPIWVPDARAEGGYVQHADFPLLPADCPSEYATLLAECLQLNHMQRPSFEQIVAWLKHMVLRPRHPSMTATISPGSGIHAAVTSPPQAPAMAQGLALGQGRGQHLPNPHQHQQAPHCNPYQQQRPCHDDKAQTRAVALALRTAAAASSMAWRAPGAGVGIPATAAAVVATAAGTAGGGIGVGGGGAAFQHQRAHGARVQPSAAVAVVETVVPLTQPPQLAGLQPPHPTDVKQPRATSPPSPPSPPSSPPLPSPTQQPPHPQLPNPLCKPHHAPLHNHTPPGQSQGQSAEMPSWDAYSKAAPAASGTAAGAAAALTAAEPLLDLSGLEATPVVTVCSRGIPSLAEKALASDELLAGGAGQSEPRTPVGEKGTADGVGHYARSQLDVGAAREESCASMVCASRPGSGGDRAAVGEVCIGGSASSSSSSFSRSPCSRSPSTTAVVDTVVVAGVCVGEAANTHPPNSLPSTSASSFVTPPTSRTKRVANGGYAGYDDTGFGDGGRSGKWMSLGQLQSQASAVRELTGAAGVAAPAAGGASAETPPPEVAGAGVMGCINIGVSPAASTANFGIFLEARSSGLEAIREDPEDA